MNLNKWDMPPIEKIHEALSAIADERVEINSDNAIVTSSNYEKKYQINWDNNTYMSNDNASYFQGYLGYPVIAVLLLQNKLPLDETVASYFKEINWHDLNNQFKRKYSEVVKFILEGLATKGIDIDSINSYINNVYEEMKTLDIFYQRSKIMPPK